MAKNKSIASFVNQIWFPDVVDTIPQDIYFSENSPYEFMLMYLIINVKECIQKDVFKPYIQIKDHNDKLIYNHRLTISLGSDEHDFVGDEETLYIDFVCDNMHGKMMYCFYRKTDDGETSVGHIHMEFEEVVILLDEMAYLEKIPTVLQALHYDITQEIKLKVNIIRHIYNDIGQKWHVEFPMKGILNLETKIKSS